MVAVAAAMLAMLLPVKPSRDAVNHLLSSSSLAHLVKLMLQVEVVVR
jgi:hypothetical protein